MVDKPREEAPGLLVVEDDRDTQLYMGAFLGKRFRVYYAASGEEARRQLAKYGKEIRMILMDLSLRGEEDGLTLTRWIRTTPQWQQIPVIATTAHAFLRDEHAALDAGCDVYMAKPLHQRRLLESIDGLLARKS